MYACGQRENRNQNARQQDAQKCAVEPVPESPPAAAQQHGQRLGISRDNGTDQSIVDAGNEGNGSSRDARHNIGSAHSHAARQDAPRRLSHRVTPLTMGTKLTSSMTSSTNPSGVAVTIINCCRSLPTGKIMRPPGAS